MFGDTLTVTLDGSGGTARVCSKINQDNYSAEYLNRISTDEIRVKIRHTTEKAAASGRVLERHNVEFSQYVYPTEALPLGRWRYAYIVTRFEPGDDIVATTDLGEALTFWLTDANLDKLTGWES